MTDTTSVLPLIGGLMIGSAATALLVLNGRIAGISGILGNAVRGPERGWQLAFIGGLILAGLLLNLYSPPPMTAQADGWQLILAGLLVGFGTRLGSGCTSGHGVCGMARLSLRSIAATAMFMATAMLTVWAMKVAGS